MNRNKVFVSPTLTGLHLPSSNHLVGNNDSDNEPEEMDIGDFSQILKQPIQKNQTILSKTPLQMNMLHHHQPPTTTKTSFTNQEIKNSNNISFLHFPTLVPVPIELQPIKIDSKPNLVNINSNKPTTISPPQQISSNQQQINKIIKIDRLTQEEMNKLWLETVREHIDIGNFDDIELQKPIEPIWKRHSTSSSSNNSPSSSPPPLPPPSFNQCELTENTFSHHLWPVLHQYQATNSTLISILECLKEFIHAKNSTSSSGGVGGGGGLKKSKKWLMPKSGQMKKKSTSTKHKNHDEQKKKTSVENLLKTISLKSLAPVPAAVYNDFKQQTRPQPITVAVLGESGSGKSTLIGRLMYQCGQVTEEQLKKLKWDMKKCLQSITHGEGRSKRAKTKRLLTQQMSMDQRDEEECCWSWLLDQLPEERMETRSQQSIRQTLTLNKRRIHLLDTPGHRDFTMDRLSALQDCDVALFVIDPHNWTEYLFSQLFLARSIGIEQFIIVFNEKEEHVLVNSPPLNLSLLKTRIENELNSNCFIYLNSDCNKMKNVGVSHCLVNARRGTNFKSDIAGGGGPAKNVALIDILNDCVPQEKVSSSGEALLHAPAFLLVDDIFKPVNSGGVCVSGHLLSGYLKNNMSDVVCWNGNDSEMLTIKGLSQAVATETYKHVSNSNLAHEEETIRCAYPHDYVCVNVHSSITTTQSLLCHQHIGSQPLVITTIPPLKHNSNSKHYIYAKVVLYEAVDGSGGFLCIGKRVDLCWRMVSQTVHVMSIEDFETEDENSAVVGRKSITWRSRSTAVVKLRLSQMWPFLTLLQSQFPTGESTSEFVIDERFILTSNGHLVAGGKLLRFSE